jgi:serine phosphatase RsbU (regulator of sigma subunit)/PAS domain-containing protein
MQPADAAVERLTALVARQRDELERLRAQAASRSLLDLARGVLMEQLGCSPDDAQRQLERLSNEAEVAVSELASQITSQPLPADEHDAGWHNLSLARGAVESASDLNAVATAMLEEALADLGATAVAMWRAEPHGGMHLIGQAGLRQSEASRWRHIHPDMRTLQQEVAHTATDSWWPAGLPAEDQRPLVGIEWPTGARAALPITDAGRAVGAMIVCWPDRLEAFTEPQRKQLLALADIASHAILAGAAQEWPFDQQTGSAIGLLESLLDGLLILRPIVDTDGSLSDFKIDHVYGRPPGFGPYGGTAVFGRTLLEVCPAAASEENLFDQCVEVLETGSPRFLAGDSLAALHPQADEGVPPTVRIARFFDGVAISWREAQDADRSAALLQQVQRLGRIGAWEEDLRTGEVRWTQSTYQLFGLQEADPVSIGDLHRWVPDEDQSLVQGFRRSLLDAQRVSAAAFRLVRADDSIRQMRAYAEPVSDGTGAPVAIRGAYQDVSTDYHTRLAFAAAREQLADTEERAAEERYLALRLQEAITPRAEPFAAAGLDIAARYRPFGLGELVGGDWYDTIELPDGQILLVIGDIAGHGLDAVTGMVAMRNGLRGLAATGAQPATLLGWLNAATCHFMPGVMGTVICGCYDPATGSLTWARAGHLPPVLVRDGDAQVLEPPSGTMLGVDPEATFTDATTVLLSHDTLLLFTDGLIERRDQSIDDAIDALLRRASNTEGNIGPYADKLVDEASSNTDDDTCLLAVRVH